MFLGLILITFKEKQINVSVWLYILSLHHKMKDPCKLQSDHMIYDNLNACYTTMQKFSPKCILAGGILQPTGFIFYG